MTTPIANMNLALDQYLNFQKRIFDYFGYVEDWVVIPISDDRRMYWHLDEEPNDGSGTVRYHEDEFVVRESEDLFYEDEIYTQRFLPKWVYRAADYTMICCNPGVDGNKFLRIFDNKKEV